MFDRFRIPPLLVVLILGLASGCPGDLDGPAPSLDRVEPELVCGEQLTSTITVSGSGLSPIVVDTLTDAPYVVLPSFALERISDVLGVPVVSAPLTLGDASDSGSVRWDSQDQMTFDVTPELELEPGVYDLSVTNANGKGATLEDAFTVVPPPTVATVDPNFFCSEQIVSTLTITGQGFLSIGGLLPLVSIGGVGLQADSVGDCQPLAGPAGGETCNEIIVTVEPGTLQPGLHDVVVTNPPPADCISTEPVQVEVVAPPEISDVILNPICTEQFDQQIIIEGSGFLVVDGVLPTVTIGTTDFAPDGAENCTDLTVPNNVQSCTRLLVTILQGSLGPGDHDVVVTNPEPAGCQTSVPFTLTVSAPPVLESIAPAEVCTGGGLFTANGTGFSPGAEVTVDGTPADTVTWISDSELEVSFGMGLEVGIHDVTVTNQDGCSDTLVGAVTVVPGPITFFVDPPIVYNGISIQATIYVSGITDSVVSVEIVNVDTSVSTSLSFTWDPSRPGRILAVIPSGLDAGQYDVIVTDNSGCPAILSAGLTVVDTLEVAVESISPPFGWVGTFTAAGIRAVDPAPPGMVQFAATPRAYLNPTVPGPGTVAMPLRSVAFVGATLVSAVVPDGLPVDTYDLIVVNPDGTVGLLPAAFQVVADAPPTIDNIQPGSLPTNSDGTVNIVGDNFRNPTVELICRDSGNPPVTTVYGAADGITLDSTGIDQIQITVPAATGVAADSVCVVRVTNDDGTWAEFSALAITSPSENLVAWTAGPPMTTARRAPVALAGRATQVARFLYAIGGDDGSTAGGLSSVEAASVSVFGDVGDWFELPYALPEARTLAGGVRLGRFLYLVGGNSGSGTVSTVYRAEILDPLDAPRLSDISITTGDGTGLGGGIWYYRVSAVFDATDDRNPDGESLASDPLVVQLPALALKIHLTLLWNQVPGAVGYRIYRSPMPDMISGDEELLVEVSGGGTNQYTDQGEPTITPTEIPLPLGATGRWRELVSQALNVPREGMGLALGAEPGASSSADATGVFYIYAIGGQNDPTVHASYEYLPITVNTPTDHVVGTWQTDPGNDLSAARWQLGAYVLSSYSSSVVPAGETWIYAGAGLDGGGGTDNTVEAAQVQVGGALGAWVGTDSLSPPRAGYGYVGVNNFLFAFGGLQGSPDAGGVSARLCEVGVGGCGPIPDLQGFNNLGINMSVPRYLMGTTLESAFIFIVGGETGAGPTNSVDSTIW